MHRTARHRRSSSPRQVRVFDGFPYLATQLAPGIYRVTEMPPDLGDVALVELARAQVAASKRDICLVLAANTAVYLSPDGKTTVSAEPPKGRLLHTRG
jgi:hypothetical protein